MNKSKIHIVVVCNYVLREDRIGGMDRFFVAYNAFARAQGFQISWYFKGDGNFPFYQGLELHCTNSQEVEQFFLEELKKGQSYTHLITHFTSLCSSFYKKVRKLSAISYIQVVDHNPRPLDGFPLKKRLKNRIKSILYSRYIDQFIGVSNYTVDCILEDLGGRVKHKTTRVYNGIDTSVFNKREVVGRHPEHAKMKFVVVSHLRKSKGIQDLLHALAQLDQDVRRQLLVTVYGEGPYEHVLKGLAASLRLDDQVKFKGSIGHINEVLAAYDYLIQPTYMECFSLSILESLSANVPVITTTVGGNAEVIKDGINGYLFSPKEVSALTKILEELVLGQRAITQPTAPLIETDFNLKQMVEDHFKLVSCT
ncbi:glycosyltransferase family 4 protein [Croceiramulus getboli]|nr:glycosyltransferase family 4 protein [Flavobacteriaceae bacterium YJPT1-3]